MIKRLALIAVSLAAFSVSAAVDPSLFRDLQWRLIGPFRGGRVLAVTGVPGDPEHFYFGSVNGGVWETRDAGRTWQPIFDSQPVGSIGAIAVAPSNPGVLYVGSGEADMRSDIAQGNGMYRSADGGATWTHIGLTDSQQIGKIVVDPGNPDVVFVAALGHPYAANAERGVFRSTDGGRSWSKVLGRELKKPAAGERWDGDTGAVDLALDPSNPRVIYAALWQTRRTPWSVYPPSNGPGSGLFKTVDGGDTWTEIRGHGFPASPGRIGIAIAPKNPQRVYAMVDADAGGMYRSDDAGATWKRTSSDSRIWARGWYFGGVTVEPDDPDVVYSANINLFRSADGGVTWAPVKGAPGGDDYHTLWIDPRQPQRRILGVDQGCVVSTNGGKTWSSWYNQPTGQFYHVITDDRFPYWVYGAQQDSGAAAVPSRTNTIDGITMTSFREITAGGESDNVAPDPRDPAIVYGGRVEKLDRRTEQTRSVDPTLGELDQERRTWTLPLVFSRRDPHVLYFANQKMFRTIDGGEHWSVISPDLTREKPGTPPNLDPATAALQPRPGGRHGVIYAIAPSRRADHDIWAGTDDGLIWRTHDEGAHWDNITPPSLTAWSKVGIIETSHFDADTAYATVDRHRLDDFKPYILKTHDGGRTWTPISAGIPDGSFVNAVREDGQQRGLLFAGTEKGVYVSFDDGESWQSLQQNLPVTSVRDLDVHGNDLVIATHGRAFWVMDGITPLRSASAAARAGSAYLFPPAPAVRERTAGFTGTPMPKDEPLAPNPPAGAYIDYLLTNAQQEPVTIEILDGHGQLVRRYSSSDARPQPDPAKLRVAAEWFVNPSTISTSPGMHRFVWPLRYEAAPGLRRASEWWANGVWAPPGDYSVVLTVSGNRLTQPLSIFPDPRLHLDAAAYRQQFEFASAVTALWSRTNTAAQEADVVIEALVARRTVATGDLAKRIDVVLGHAAEIADVTPATNLSNNWWIDAKRTNSLRFVNAHLEKLANAADEADAAPSPDARAGFDLVRAPAEKAVADWDAFRSGELKKLDEELRRARLEPVLK